MERFRLGDIVKYKVSDIGGLLIIMSHEDLFVRVRWITGDNDGKTAYLYKECANFYDKVCNVFEKNKGEYL